MTKEGMEIEDMYNLLTGYISNQPVEIRVKIGEREHEAYPMTYTTTGEIVLDKTEPSKYTEDLAYTLRTEIYDVDKEGINADSASYVTIPYEKIVSCKPIKGVVYKNVPFVVFNAFSRMIMDLETQIDFDRHEESGSCTSGTFIGKITGLDDDRLYIQNGDNTLRIRFEDIEYLDQPHPELF